MALSKKQLSILTFSSWIISETLTPLSVEPSGLQLVTYRSPCPFYAVKTQKQTIADNLVYIWASKWIS